MQHLGNLKKMVIDFKNGNSIIIVEGQKVSIDSDPALFRRLVHIPCRFKSEKETMTLLKQDEIAAFSKVFNNSNMIPYFDEYNNDLIVNNTPNKTPMQYLDDAPMYSRTQANIMVLVAIIALAFLIYNF